MQIYKYTLRFQDELGTMEKSPLTASHTEILGGFWEGRRAWLWGP